MKTKWYSIEARKDTDLIDISVPWLIKHIKRIKNYGHTMVMDYDGMVHHVFRAKPFDRLFIFFKLLPLNIKRLLKSKQQITLETGKILELKQPIMCIRLFKPYGRKFIFLGNSVGKKSTLLLPKEFRK